MKGKLWKKEGLGVTQLVQGHESEAVSGAHPRPFSEKRSLLFKVSEYERRLQRLRQHMVECDFDIVMIQDPANFAYLTGHQTSGYGTFQALIVPVYKEPFTITRLLEESNIITRTWVKKTRTYLDHEDPIRTTWEALKEFGLTRQTIGIEKGCFFLPAPMQEKVHHTFSSLKLLDCSGLVERSRLIKSEAELQVMRKAARITQKAMRAGIEAIEAGVTENDVAAMIHYAAYRAGGEYPAVPPYVTSGSRTLIGHATWEGRRIRWGDCVFLEIGGCYRRYHTAMMRTVFVGNPPKELLIAEKIVNDAVNTAMKAMKPGVPAGYIDSLCRAICENNKIGATQITRSGYSIGLAFAPSWDEGHILSLKQKEERLLEKNMTFHLIPWLQLPRMGMVMGLSETVVVTEQGAKSFFDMKRKLHICH